MSLFEQLDCETRSPLCFLFSIRSVGTPLPPLSQTNNRIAGWFDVRTFGSRSWSHLWVVLSVEGPPGTNSHASHPSLSNDPKVGAGKTKNRISKLFGGGASPPELTTTPYPPVPGESSPTGMGPGRGSEMSLASVAGGRPVVSAQFYTVPPKSTLSRSPASSGQVPFLTVTDVSQAFAVYPEVETEIDNSAMFKVEGHLAGEAMGPSSRRDEGWILMIPMEKEGELFTAGKRSDMLRWLAGESRPPRSSLASSTVREAHILLLCSLPRRLRALWSTCELLLGRERSQVAALRSSCLFLTFARSLRVRATLISVSFSSSAR